MAILFIIIIITAFLYASFILYINHVIDNYIQNTQVKHLKPLGVDENQFIGLHKKELGLKGGYMIYARKTTAYKGVILFNPDQDLSYRFYMPLINFLCRQGFIITTYQNQHEFYSKSVNDLMELYKHVTEDEILGTYPLSCIGHGSGALAQLCTVLPKIYSSVCFQPRALEIDEICKSVKYNHPKIKEMIIKTIEKKYGTSTRLVPNSNCPTYIIYGDQDQLETLTVENASIRVLSGQGRYPFLNIDSEQHVKSLECLLAFPNTPQFEYNKALENFETTTLYDLNQDVLEILPYLLETEK